MDGVNGEGSPPVVCAAGLTRVYGEGAREVRALEAVSLTVGRGELLCITGPSGSGKTTLLNLLAGLDLPTSGSVVVDGHELSRLSANQLADFRRTNVGFVFQFFELLPGLRAWENVAVPGLLSGARLGRLRSRALDLLDRVGLADRAEHLPAELSGGELQRVALARAVFLEPPLVVADEPTGNLDSESGAVVSELLSGVARDGRAVVMATHDARLAEHATSRIELRDGRAVVRAAEEMH